MYNICAVGGQSEKTLSNIIDLRELNLILSFMTPITD